MKSASARDYKELLRTGRWFRGLPEDLQDALLGAAVLRSLAPGEVLFSRGDAPGGLFAVVEGAMRIAGVSASGKEALLTLTEPPAWFGEISVFDGLPRTHDAQAESPTRVLQVPQEPLLALLDAQPRRWRELGLLLASKLRLTFTAMEDMALLPNPVRLARRLALMAQGYGERAGHSSRVLEVTQEQLAMMLSLSRQTANQLLKDLEAQGLIQVRYGSIEVLDLEGLRRAGLHGQE